MKKARAAPETSPVSETTSSCSPRGPTGVVPASKTLGFLVSHDDPAIVYFARRDLLDQPVGPLAEQVWSLPDARKLFRGQLLDGSFQAPTSGYPLHHRRIGETFKRMRLLIARYGFDRSHAKVAQAAEYLFSTQTNDGDFRGMVGDQYATYYTGEFAALLVRAGYGNDVRIEQAFRWLLHMRQDDGGWSIPVLTRGLDMQQISRLTNAPSEPLEPDRSRPFSHNWTDMVLRAFAAHPSRRHSPEARRAGELLKASFFLPDAYFSMKDAGYWVRFVHHWPNLLTATESLSAMGYTRSDPHMARAVDWFEQHRLPDGSFRTSYFRSSDRNPKLERREAAWVTLRIARVLRALQH